MLARSRALDALAPARVRVPCPEHLVLHNVVHAMLHHRGFRLSEVSLRDALDLALLARSFGDDLDWAAIGRRMATEPDGAAALEFYLGVCRALLPEAPLPDLAPGPPARAALRRWRRRRGGHASRLAHAVDADAASSSQDLSWRLRHVPDQRRRLLAIFLTPRRYPGTGAASGRRAAIRRDPAAGPAGGPARRPGPDLTTDGRRDAHPFAGGLVLAPPEPAPLSILNAAAARDWRAAQAIPAAGRPRSDAASVPHPDPKPRPLGRARAAGLRALRTADRGSVRAAFAGDATSRSASGIPATTPPSRSRRLTLMRTPTRRLRAGDAGWRACGWRLRPRCSARSCAASSN